MRLQGKVALVTGAGSNPGKVYALALASEGASVVIGDIDGELARSAARDVAETGVKTLGCRAGPDLQVLMASIRLPLNA